MNSDNITIIVRSVGERTEAKCVERLAEQFETDEIIVIRNVMPFSKALQKTFETGIKKGKKWTFVVDADLFFEESKLIEFFELAENLLDKRDDILCVMSCIYDNFMCQSRHGVHLYYTPNMSKGLNFIRNETKRPETNMLNHMDSIGYFTYKINLVVGIHDFFQSYRDIVAKAILQCSKSSNINEMRQLWEQKQNENRDYYWMLKGCEIADRINLSMIRADSKMIREIIARDITEFPEQNEITDEEIDETLNRYKNEIVCEKLFFIKKPKFGDFVKSFIWNLKVTQYLKTLKRRVAK